MNKKKIKPKLKPTPRQKKVIKALSANGGSLADAMRSAGYAESYARNPQKMTASETWQELLERVLPDSKLTEKLDELLESSTVDTFYVDKKLEDPQIHAIARKARVKIFLIQRDGRSPQTRVYISKPDSATQRAALDMGFKVKGLYAAERLDLNVKGRPVKANPEHHAEIMKTLAKIRRNVER